MNTLLDRFFNHSRIGETDVSFQFLFCLWTDTVNSNPTRSHYQSNNKVLAMARMRIKTSIHNTCVMVIRALDTSLSGMTMILSIPSFVKSKVLYKSNERITTATTQILSIMVIIVFGGFTQNVPMLI